jgi:Ser/Thr protein kinase RdoA (MazF antagonist)
MADFKTLSLGEQQIIWMQLGCEVIKNWNLVVKDVSWLGYTNNAVLKVDTESGAYVLRLHPPGRIDIPTLIAELEWLKVIRRNTNLSAPYPKSTVVDGEDVLFVTVYSDKLPSPNLVYCTLFDYVEGEPKPAQDITSDDMRRVGEYLGKLHTAGQFTPPQGFVRPWLNWEGLFGENSPYNPRENAHIITAEQLAVFDKVANRVQQTMEDVGQDADAFGLVHADMLAKNILFYEDEPRALDFEYCGWGYYLYDLTPLLWQLKSERSYDYQQLEDAMWAGYTSVKPQPDSYRDLLDVFIAGRQLASCRWLAVNLDHPMVRDIAPQLLAQRTEELKQFLDTGKLERQSRTL